MEPGLVRDSHRRRARKANKARGEALNASGGRLESRPPDGNYLVITTWRCLPLALAVEIAVSAFAATAGLACAITVTAEA